MNTEIINQVFDAVEKKHGVRPKPMSRVEYINNGLEKQASNYRKQRKQVEMQTKSMEEAMADFYSKGNKVD